MRSLAPAVFVFIWSTGFVVGRGVSAHADANLFLGLRFLAAAAIFAAAAAAARAPWPRRPRAIGMHLAAGALMSGLYLGAGWWAMEQGLPAGVMALLGALQPIFTALVSVVFLRARLAATVWLGLAIGIAGVAMVLLPRLAVGAGAAGAAAFPPVAVAGGVVGILSLTLGTMVQKSSLADADIRSASALQNLGAACVSALLLLAVGTPRWDHAAALWGSFAWSVLVLSLGGTTLLIWLMRRGEATRTTALLLLVPPLAAVQAWLLFGETLTAVQVAGFALAIAGVALARR
ncbi:MAG: DMT family transporter [Xylophilus ampelinus]